MEQKEIKELSMSQKDILKVKETPEIKTYVSVSKDGKWVIIKRVETQIFSKNYISTIINNTSNVSEDNKQSNKQNLMDDLE